MNAIGAAVAEGVKILVDAVLAVDNERLVRLNFVSPGEVFKYCGHDRNETLRERPFFDIGIMSKSPRHDVKGTLAMAGLDPGGRVNLDVGEADAVLLGKLVVD